MADEINFNNHHKMSENQNSYTLHHFCFLQNVLITCFSKFFNNGILEETSVAKLLVSVLFSVVLRIFEQNLGLPNQNSRDIWI